MKTFSVIIPTRNRNKLLSELIDSIPVNNHFLQNVIIVDSSDDNHAKDYAKNKIIYIHTKIKSAAIQRNIGIQSIDSAPEIVFFLDDDVRIQPLYFDKIIENFCDKDIAGVSGLALNMSKPSRRNPPTGISGYFKKIFLLDSTLDGVLLKSAINIPVRAPRQPRLDNVMVDWLIGCSAWRIGILNKVKFEDFFTGQSLGEDVLFSTKARKFGKLIVNTNVILDHIESSINRPNQYEFYKMWVENRYRISSELNLSILNWAFHWSNLGKITAIIFSSQPLKRKSLLGFWCGYKEIVWKS